MGGGEELWFMDLKILYLSLDSKDGFLLETLATNMQCNCWPNYHPLEYYLVTPKSQGDQMI